MNDPIKSAMQSASNAFPYELRVRLTDRTELVGGVTAEGKLIITDKDEVSYTYTINHDHIMWVRVEYC